MSFKINRNLNCWYDHGIGKKGGLIDFAILYHNSTIAKFLKQLSRDFSFHQPVTGLSNEEINHSESQIKIIAERTISSLALKGLKQRRIPINIAKEYCKKVIYKLNDKEYYNISFKNDAGGYESRDQYRKLSSAPKDLTTLPTGAKEAVVS